jgi:transposase
MASGELTDAEWDPVGPLLPPEGGRPGRPGHANRPVLDGILWRAREGARRRSIPERYGKWNSVWRRFARWRDLGLFEAVFAALAESGAAGERVQMLDGTIVRARQHAAGAKGGRTVRRWAARAGGVSTKLHLRRDARGLPLAVALTPGQTHELRAFDELTEGLAPGTRRLIGDAGYDADRAREDLLLRGVLPVIPANPVRKQPAPLDRELYRLRDRVERLVSRLKRFRAVATRYDKTAESFLASVHLAAARVWLRFVHTA